MLSVKMVSLDTIDPLCLVYFSYVIYIDFVFRSTQGYPTPQHGMITTGFDLSYCRKIILLSQIL